MACIVKMAVFTHTNRVTHIELSPPTDCLTPSASSPLPLFSLSLPCFSTVLDVFHSSFTRLLCFDCFSKPSWIIIPFLCHSLRNCAFCELSLVSPCCSKLKENGWLCKRLASLPVLFSWTSLYCILPFVVVLSNLESGIVQIWATWCCFSSSLPPLTCYSALCPTTQ